MNPIDLNPTELDFFKEVGSIGVGHAATALSQLIGRPVRLDVPEVSVAPLTDIPDLIGGPEKVVAGLYLKFYGGAQGTIFVVFPRESALEIISLLAGTEREGKATLTEMDVSVLKEVGNILASSFLSAVSRLADMVLIPSVPAISFDMAGAVIDYLLIELCREEDHALLIKTRFDCTAGVTGHFFLIPDPASMDLILDSLRRNAG